MPGTRWVDVSRFLYQGWIERTANDSRRNQLTSHEKETMIARLWTSGNLNE